MPSEWSQLVVAFGLKVVDVLECWEFQAAIEMPHCWECDDFADEEHEENPEGNTADSQKGHRDDKAGHRCFDLVLILAEVE